MTPADRKDTISRLASQAKADRIAELERERDDLKRAFLNASEVIADQDHRLETLVAERDAAIKRAEEAERALHDHTCDADCPVQTLAALNAKLVEALCGLLAKLDGMTCEVDQSGEHHIGWCDRVLGNQTTCDCPWPEMQAAQAALDAAGKGVGR